LIRSGIYPRKIGWVSGVTNSGLIASVDDSPEDRSAARNGPAAVAVLVSVLRVVLIGGIGLGDSVDDQRFRGQAVTFCPNIWGIKNPV